MFNEQHFTRDAAIVRFDDDAPGITVDDDGETSFDWDEVETVTLDDPPHAEAFDTKEFYKIPATVARPIRQPYHIAGDTVWLKKPRQELKRAAWSLDNAPWTHGHPENQDGSQMVKSVDDVRGFWRDPRYIDSVDDLDADLHVPVGDEKSKQYLEENSDVSVGFYNRIERVDEYDGIVGGMDDTEEDIDGYQTQMLFDHVASVKVGRCPSGKGCGIDSADLSEHGHVEPIYKGTRLTDEGRETDGPMEADQSSHTHEGSWYAVPPEDNPDDEWKFPIDNCSDVQDAWKLRGHGDISISQETLEGRIKDRASDIGCEVPGSDEQTDSIDDLDYEISPLTDEQEQIMQFEIDTDDLTPDAVLAKVAEQHDGVQDRLDAYEEKAEAADEAAEELDLDCACDIPDKVGLMADEIADLREYKREAEEEEMREHAEAIAAKTDRFGEDVEDVLEAHDDLDSIESTRELVDDLTETTDTKTANPGESTDEGSTEAPQKYAKTPWS